MTATTAVWDVLLGLALLGVFSSTIFLFMALAAAIRWRRGARAAQRAALTTPESSLPAVTIFKPVHGMEAQLEANLSRTIPRLRSFLEPGKLTMPDCRWRRESASATLR